MTYVSGMRHLYSSRVAVLRLKVELEYGSPIYSWHQIEDMLDPHLGVLGEMKCRLDMAFMRPGKDIPMPVEAGRAPDRVGILFCDYSPYLKAGDRIKTLQGPVTGIFEIRQVPDAPPDYSFVHHIEVQVIEVAQSMEGVFPGSYPEE